MNARQQLGGSRLGAAAEDDGLMVVASHSEVQVAEVAFGMDQAASLDDCFDEALHAAGGSVGESLHANSAHTPASFLDRDYDLRLSGCLTAEDARLDPTNPGFVDLNDSLQEVAVGPDHGMAQLMEPGPGGAVAAQAEDLLDGHRAGALLLRRDQPDGVEPDPQRLVRVLKNGSGRDGGLVPALGTLQESSSARLPGSFTSTPGTDEAARPAQPSEVLPAAGLGGEAVRELGEGARIVLDDRQAISNSNLSQVHGQNTNMCSVGGERGSWTSGEVFEEINSLLNRLQSEDLSSLPAESMGDDQIALQRIVNRVQAEGLRRLRRFDSGQGYAPSGALSARAWLRWQLNLTANAASERVAVSRKMPALPRTEQALVDGDISYRHVALIAETASQLGDKFEAQAETILVETAKEVCPWRLQRAIWHLKHCLDSEGVLSDANKSHDRRFLHMSQTLDGAYRIDGWLDGEGGAVLNTALNSVMGPRLADDDRSATERRADAAVEMARRLLDGGQLPEVGGQKPHLAVSVDMATLSKEPSSMAAELEWSQPIPAETARRLACDAAITPIIDGEADRTSRVVPSATRRALSARDKGCRFPGCDCPPAWTDAHHIQHWADGGATTLGNLILLCRRHHRLVHEEGWTLELAQDRELVAIPP